MVVINATKRVGNKIELRKILKIPRQAKHWEQVVSKEIRMPI